MESQNLSVTVGSTFSQKQDDHLEMFINEGQELKNNKKFKKLRSIKLSKSPSTRRSKSHLRNILFHTDNSSSQFSSLSDSRTDISMKLARPLTRRSSFKAGMRSLTRMSSKKSRKPSMMNSKSDHDQFSVVSTPNSSKSTNGSNARKMQFQASPGTPEYGFSGSADRTKGTTSSGQKSERTFTRKASLKPLKASTKSKRSSVKTHSEISAIADSSVERATCSSTLKDSKFADTLQLEQGGSESEVDSAVKVCPFSYCSLHGHRHANVPPLKRLISVRRRMRQESRTVRREKNPVEAKKGIQKNLGEAKSNGFSNRGEEDAKFTESSSLSETLVRETSYPLSQLEENINHDSLQTVPEPMENSLECSSTSKELVKPDSETSAQQEEFVCREKNPVKARKGIQKNLGEAKSHGFSNHGEEDAKFTESSSLSETLVRETSYPFSQLKENINHDSLQTVPEPMENGLECSSTSKELLNPDSETSAQQEESVGFSNHGEEDAKFTESSSLSETLVRETSYPLSQLEENINHDSLQTVPEPMETGLECSSTSKELVKPDSETSAQQEESVALKQGDGDSNSVLNGSELSDKNMEGGDATTGEPPDELTTPTTNEYVETTSKIGASSGSQSEKENEQAAAGKDEKENIEPDHGFFQFPPLDSEPKSPKNAAQRMQLKDQKYVRMWRLMYKHAVKGVAENVENHSSLDGVDKAEQVGDAQVLVESNNSQSSQGSSEMDRDTLTESVNEGNQQMECYQIDAVKLVQEAFDQILLPEIQEVSSDDQSVTSDTGSDHEIVEQDQADGEQRITGTESTSSQKEEKTSSKAGDKPNQKASKSWSNLKKIIILKRFVKALDKVKKINRGTPQYLPLQPEPEAEKVNLRRQTSTEQKNAEEWMLDFALQQVISKLDPAQQRKVAILVKAFETVLPLPDLKSSPSFNLAAYPTQVDPGSVLVQSGEKIEVSVGETSPSTKSGNEYADQVNDFLKAEPRDKAEFPTIEETCEECSSSKQELDLPLFEATNEDRKDEKSSASDIDDSNSKFILPSDQPETFSTSSDGRYPRRSLEELNEDDTKSASDDSLLNGNAEEVEKQLDMSTTSEPGNAGNGMFNTTLESNDIISADSKQAFTSENRAAVDDPESSTEKDEPESEFVQESSPSEGSESDSTTDVAQDPQVEKQSYMRLWGFVYKHMMTGIAANEGTNVDDGSDEEKADGTKTMLATDVPVSGQSFAEKDQDTGMKDDAADKQKTALRRFEAIKLIEKAIDEIILPENQDKSHGDGQSTASDQISDEEPQEKKVVLERKSFISDSTVVSNESFGESGKKEGEHGGVQEREEGGTTTNNTTLQEEQKTSSNKQIPRSWSNLKKMILLKRFIKALEHVRKFNPKGPRFLPLEADPEAEKVNLKHLEMDEKRSAEEWMLDHALQQAVTRLTPARKKKVKLLVEAFETVTPTVRS